MSNDCSLRTQLSKKWTLIKHLFPPLCIWEYFANLTGALRLVSRERISLLLSHSQALVLSPGKRKRIYLLASKSIFFSKNETGDDWKTIMTTKEKGRQFPPQDRLYPNLLGKLDTVKLRFTDTCLTRTVCFVPGKRKPLHFFKFNPLYTDTPLIRTLSMAPLACINGVWPYSGYVSRRGRERRWQFPRFTVCEMEMKTYQTSLWILFPPLAPVSPLACCSRVPSHDFPAWRPMLDGSW